MWEFSVLRVGVQRATKPTVQGHFLGLQNTCDRDHSTAPTLLPSHLSQLAHPYCRVPQLQATIRIRVQRPTKPFCSSLKSFFPMGDERKVAGMNIIQYFKQ